MVGAGPVGLFMAAELCRHGVSCRIIDKNDAPVQHARASVVQARTLEVLDSIGIADQFVNAGAPCHATATYTPEMKPIKYVSDDELDSPFRFSLGIEQYNTEDLLTRHLASLGREVERRVELRRFVQDEHGVTAVLGRAGEEEETIRVSYLIGCDGAHSTVRHALGVAFEGKDYPRDFLIADVVVDWRIPIPENQITFFVGPEGMLFHNPFAEGRCVLAADIGVGHGEHPPAGEPSVAELQTIVDTRSPGGVVGDPRWRAYYRAHGRQADRYQVGRVFLAGDAAHVQSPAGGLGMNTGIQDAYNLAWKVGLVLQEGVSDAMLDSYHAERHRVGHEMLLLNDYLHQSLVGDMPDLPLPDALRRQLAIILAGQEVIQRRMGSAIAELNINYRHSPIVLQHRGPVPSRDHEHQIRHGWHDFGAAPHAGNDAVGAQLSRYPSGESVRFFQLLRGTKHHLVLFAGPDPTEETYERLQAVAHATTRTYERTVEAHLVTPHQASLQLQTKIDTLVDLRGDLHHRYGANIECLYLVRPDGYIGFRSQPIDDEVLQSYLASVFGP